MLVGAASEACFKSCDGRGLKRKKDIKVVIARGIHLFPFRTEKLSPVTPMVLRNSGRVGSRRFGETKRRKPVQRNAGSAFGVLRGLEGGAPICPRWGPTSAADGVCHLGQMSWEVSSRCQKGSAADGRGDLRQMSGHGCLRGEKEGAGGWGGDKNSSFLYIAEEKRTKR